MSVGQVVESSEKVENLAIRFFDIIYFLLSIICVLGALSLNYAPIFYAVTSFVPITLLLFCFRSF